MWHPASQKSWISLAAIFSRWDTSLLAQAMLKSFSKLFFLFKNNLFFHIAAFALCLIGWLTIPAVGLVLFVFLQTVISKKAVAKKKNRENWTRKMDTNITELMLLYLVLHTVKQCIILLTAAFESEKSPNPARWPPQCSYWLFSSTRQPESVRKKDSLLLSLSVFVLLSFAFPLLSFPQQKHIRFTFINIMLCVFLLCVMERALPCCLMYMNERLLHGEWLLLRKSMTVLSRNRVWIA